MLSFIAIISETIYCPLKCVIMTSLAYRWPNGSYVSLYPLISIFAIVVFSPIMLLKKIDERVKFEPQSSLLEKLPRRPSKGLWKNYTKLHQTFWELVVYTRQTCKYTCCIQTNTWLILSINQRCHLSRVTFKSSALTTKGQPDNIWAARNSMSSCRFYPENTLRSCCSESSGFLYSVRDRQQLWEEKSRRQWCWRGNGTVTDLRNITRQTEISWRAQAVQKEER